MLLDPYLCYQMSFKLAYDAAQREFLSVYSGKLLRDRPITKKQYKHSILETGVLAKNK